MIPVVDRVPTYPNRIKLTYANGDTEYVTWERADEPTVEGTPLNKALFDSIAADIGLSGGDTDLYVSSAGSDILNDGSAARPFATITKALSTLPKNLNGCDANIHIAAGTYNEVVSASGFYGGRVVLQGTASSTAVNVTGISIVSAELVRVSNTITFTVGASGIDLTNNSHLDVDGNITVNGASTGVRAHWHSQLHCSGTLTVNDTTTYAIQTNAGRVHLNKLAGSGNVVGFSVNRGGVVTYATSTLVATTASQTSGGGRVYAAGQTGSISTEELADGAVTKAKLGSDVTPAAIGAAALDARGKVKATQVTSYIKTVSDSTYTVTPEDTFVRFTYSGEVAVTFPHDEKMDSFPLGTEIELHCGMQATSMRITTDDTAKTSFFTSNGPKLEVKSDGNTRYAVIVLKRVLANRWLVKGEVE